MTIGLPWGLALASGVNTYLPLFLMALFARFSHLVQVSPRFQWLISDQALVILGLLAAGEILAQKFPALDNVWDFLHTLLRPIAGALAAGATLSPDGTFEEVLGMLAGGTLAAAAHSAKSSVRLLSTSKTLGLGNPLLSLVEDISVVAGTLAAIYAPWVMLVVVIFFALVFTLLAPWLVRTLLYDLRILAGWFAWLWGKATRAPRPSGLHESLLDVHPGQLRALARQLQPDEELLGVLSGWKRSRWGPRRARLLVTTHRWLLVQRRWLRRPAVRPYPYRDVVMVRHRDTLLLTKLDVLTRQNESLTLHLPKSQSGFAALAGQRVREVPTSRQGAEPLAGASLASAAP
ncbi:MAG: DUF4126 domain-containing protein [Acidobacteriia bacterium]|nr:DUF4126 domain-containing protein [Terriglobia bacterium]